MEQLELTIEEFKLLAVILSQITLKMPDAELIVPIYQKIKAKVPPELPVESETTNNVKEGEIVNG